MRRRLATATAAALASLAALAACGGDGDGDEPGQAESAAAAQSGGGLRVDVLATGLDVPWDVAFLPDGRALVTERVGRIRLASRGGGLASRPVGRVAVAAEGEGGLLGLAVDPDFAEGRPFVYVYATRQGEMQVRRMRWSSGRLRDDGLVLGGIAAGTIHDSGRLRFGPDDRLYVATGDAGRRQLSQQRGSLNGKILRLTPAQYRSRTTRPEVFSTGHRNPQGLAWQPGSDRLFTTDHGASGFDGPSGDDEVNVVSRGSNHGWPLVRGRDHGRFAEPAQVYATTIAPSGLTFATREGTAWTGDLLVAALKGQTLRRLSVDGGRVTSDRPLLRNRFGRLRAIVEAPDGSLWVTTSNRDGYGSPRDGRDDRLLRLRPPSA